MTVHAQPPPINIHANQADPTLCCIALYKSEQLRRPPDAADVLYLQIKRSKGMPDFGYALARMQ